MTAAGLGAKGAKPGGWRDPLLGARGSKGVSGANTAGAGTAGKARGGLSGNGPCGRALRAGRGSGAAEPYSIIIEHLTKHKKSRAVTFFHLPPLIYSSKKS